MLEIPFGARGHARLWFDEIIPARLKEEHVATATSDLIGMEQPGHQSAGIEAYIPLGGQFGYGLIGGYCSRAAPIHKHTVKVFAPGEGDDVLLNSLGGAFVSALVGLPSEYTQPVCEGVIDGLSRCTSVEIVVSHGAHSQVGSSPRLFRLLAGMLRELFFQADTSEPVLKELIDRFQM